MKKYTQTIKEPCGHTMTVNMLAMVVYHSEIYRSDMIDLPSGLVKRTYCDECCTYWDTPYKKIEPLA